MFQSAPAKQLRESKRRVPLPLAGRENERRQDGLRFLEAHIDFAREAAQYAKRNG
jgi:hypothetical protein